MQNGVKRTRASDWPGRGTVWAVVGAAVIASVIAAWSMAAGRVPSEQTAAQAVGLRFPPEWNVAPVALRRIEDDLESRFFFSTQPSAAPAPAPQQTAYADPAATDAIAKPAKPNRNAIFNDAQIVNLRDRLKLSTAQKAYWPPVEQALRALTWTRGSGKNASKTATIDTASPEVQRLRDAAGPLMKSLREEQKREVQMMARLMGLEGITSLF